MLKLVALPMLSSFLALVFAAILFFKLRVKSSGTEEMEKISKLIQDGASTFIEKEYRYLSIFLMGGFLVLVIIPSIKPEVGIAFIFGGVLSALAGVIGVRVATSSNAKTTQGVRENISEGLRVAFSSGSVMGMCVVGFGLLGISLSYILFKDPQIIYGFGFGASSIALFSRIGGGIYTKGADIGADMVGKVEEKIPEDDPRNPAVIADNVGDNVGDVAGMGADLFESYVDSIIAAMAIGTTLSLGFKNPVVLPLVIASVGILASIIGNFFVRGRRLHRSLNKGVLSAAIITIAGFYLLVKINLTSINILFSALGGLIAGVVIGLTTQYYTSYNYSPTKTISKSSQTGTATNIITGLSIGMESTLIPTLSIVSAIMAGYLFSGLYGVAIASVGLLSTTGITLATDTYGPISDNAAGIAKMSGIGDNAREKAEKLDEAGNTTAAIGKGFAIGSAALTAVALFSAYSQEAGIKVISITNPAVISGLLVGALLPFLFSSRILKAVGKTSHKMVKEVRKQFEEKDILKGKKEPDYSRCIDISTQEALRDMIFPTIIAIIVPIAVGVILGKGAVGGLLAGSIVTGFLLAVTMANSGGAWDNAKKYIETGKFGGKGSDAHASSVVGDTVGDGMKDAAGPSLNILIKLMSIVALVFLPVFL